MTTKLRDLTLEEFRKLQLEILSDFFGPIQDNRKMIHGIPALSKILGVSIPVVKGWVKRNEIPCIKLTKRKFLFVLDEVLKVKEVTNG
jgi:hypothetical protein